MSAGANGREPQAGDDRSTPEQELDLARRERDAAVASAARANEQLAAIRASRSWRITRPLRMLGRRGLDGD